MAYDKVVDSAALEAALKASADAIRGKTGGAGSIPWDTVKGFADAIAAIETGGGSGGGSLRYVEGSFTLAEDTKSNFFVNIDASVLKNENETPTDVVKKCNGLVWLCEDDSTIAYDTGSYGGVWASKNSSVLSRASYGGGWTGSGSYYSGSNGLILTQVGDGKFFMIFGSGAAYIGKAGYTYRYFIWRAYE